MREFLYDNNAMIAKEHEGGEYPRSPDNLSCCHPPTSADPKKRQEKLDANR